MPESTIRRSTQGTTLAAVIHGYGGPEQLVVAEIPMPEPSASQVLVGVGAISVNPVDLTTRAGRNIPLSEAQFPMVLGWDVAGTVLARGTAVTDLEVGDRVAAMVFQPIDQRGTYAAHLALDGTLLAKIPDELTLQQAATLPLAALTAAQLLDEVSTDGAKTLLVTGALGAVGRYVVALAAQAGLEVLGAVAPERADDLRALGASAAVGRNEFTAPVRERYPDGIDAAIDLVGGRPPTPRSTSCAAAADTQLPSRRTSTRAVSSSRPGGSTCMSTPFSRMPSNSVSCWHSPRRMSSPLRSRPPSRSQKPRTPIVAKRPAGSAGGSRSCLDRMSAGLKSDGRKALPPIDTAPYHHPFAGACGESRQSGLVVERDVAQAESKAHWAAG